MLTSWFWLGFLCGAAIAAPAAALVTVGVLAYLTQEAQDFATREPAPEAERSPNGAEHGLDLPHRRAGWGNT